MTEITPKREKVKTEEEKEPKKPATTRFLLKHIPKLSSLFLLFLKRKQKRFSESLSYSAVLNELMKINDKIESTPHLNFISLLNSYKRTIDVLDGTIAYFHRKKNTIWFKEFFPEKELYESVKEDIELYYKDYPKTNLTITKNGIMIYDNYKKNQFNTLLMTVHGGKWVPKYGQELMEITEEKRFQEDDMGTDIIYGPLVLEKGGVWINAKFSRFFCDLNRARERAIYTNESEKRVKNIWKGKLNKRQKEVILKNYDQFYYVLNKLIETHRFNIIFDGHSMVHEKGRPDLSFGTSYIPAFYMPIVETMKKNLTTHACKNVVFNKPYKGGYILKYLSTKYPDVFIFSMEINKKLYMGNKHLKTDNRRLQKLSRAVKGMFHFEENREKCNVDKEDSKTMGEKPQTKNK